MTMKEMVETQKKISEAWKNEGLIAIRHNGIQLTKEVFFETFKNWGWRIRPLGNNEQVVERYTSIDGTEIFSIVGRDELTELDSEVF